MKAIGRGGDTMHVMIPEFVALAFLAVQVVAYVQILVKACDCCGDIKCCNCFGALFGGIWVRDPSHSYRLYTRLASPSHTPAWCHPRLASPPHTRLPLASPSHPDPMSPPHPRLPSPHCHLLRQMLLLSLMNILLILVTVLATALLFLAIFLGAAAEVDESMVDGILSNLPTIIDSLPSQFGDSLNDFLDRANMPAAADLDGDEMVTDATVVLGGFVALTIGHFLVLLGFSAGYFGFGARDEARLAVVGVASETTPLKK